MPANLARYLWAVATRSRVRSPMPDWAAPHLPFTTGAFGWTATVKPAFAAYSTIAAGVVYETENSGTEWDMMF
jgi:hypothetical protein